VCVRVCVLYFVCVCLCVCVCVCVRERELLRRAVLCSTLEPCRRREVNTTSYKLHELTEPDLMSCRPSWYSGQNRGTYNSAITHYNTSTTVFEFRRLVSASSSLVACVSSSLVVCVSSSHFACCTHHNPLDTHSNSCKTICLRGRTGAGWMALQTA